MARVLIPFRDRITWVAYRVGDEYDGLPERIAHLASLGYVDGGNGDEKPAPKRRATRKTAPRE